MSRAPCSIRWERVRQGGEFDLIRFVLRPPTSGMPISGMITRANRDRWPRRREAHGSVAGHAAMPHVKRTKHRSRDSRRQARRLARKAVPHRDRSLQRLGNAFGCHAFHEKPREMCVLMTENSASLGAPPRAGSPRNASTTHGGVPTTFQSCQSLAMGTVSAAIRLLSGECRLNLPRRAFSHLARIWQRALPRARS